MSKEEAIIVLENLRMDYGTCRTEREALELAIEILEKEEENNETKRSDTSIV